MGIYEKLCGGALPQAKESPAEAGLVRAFRVQC